MTKTDYIMAISNASDKNGNLLLELMDIHNAPNFQEITEAQAKEFYERIVRENGQNKD